MHAKRLIQKESAVVRLGSLQKSFREGVFGFLPPLNYRSLGVICILSSRGTFVKLLASSVAGVLLLIVIVQSSMPVYAQSASASRAASQSQVGGRTQKTGSTSKQQ